MKKVFIVDGGLAYTGLFVKMGYDIAASLKEADIVCFTGGSDVDPGLYGHKQHHRTFVHRPRDVEETAVFKEALGMGMPMVGICRGGQFLNVMSGGEMYQDVDRHTTSHNIVDATTGEVIYVSSTHHQMMKPSEAGIMVAFSNQGGNREWWDGQVFKKEISQVDNEVVYYKHTRCLCFQPHPEFTGPEMVGMRVYFKSLLERFFGEF